MPSHTAAERKKKKNKPAFLKNAKNKKKKMKR